MQHIQPETFLRQQILIDSHRFHQGMSLPNSPAKYRIPITQ